ncbi:hypothetical protein IM792_19265 [Mucilaginibacter sp. JRF]|uniref:hypothetical protein n=1 Tax=Mucilaginibacter sp. JRF TaxID=2780088 RepID=UPI00187E3C9E|nr:hypothetical protein [Mucilaginibacter sp. JRF]MBE9586597.1 hypothetical protein [Mucilaginibacter sp. JRF]
MPFDFDNLLKTLESGVLDLAKKNLNGVVDDATKDGLAIINELKADLKTWTLQLQQGTLSKEDFEYNLLSQKDLIQMIALKNAGLAKIKSDEFKNDVFNLVTNSVLKLIP